MPSFLEAVPSLIDRGERLEVCHLELQKTFDSVDHRHLDEKARAFAAGAKTNNWAPQGLEGRSFRVMLERTA